MEIQYEGAESISEKQEACIQEIFRLKKEAEVAGEAAKANKLDEYNPKIKALEQENSRLEELKKSTYKVIIE